MRLATFNLLHGVPVLGVSLEGRPDPTGGRGALPLVLDDGLLRESVAQLDADVLGLQEVDVAQPRSGGVHQVRSCALALDASHWHFAPSVAGTPGEGRWREADDADERAGNDADDVEPLYGVGLVSRLPVLEWRSTRLDAAPWTLPLVVPAQPRPRVVRVPDEPRAAIAAVIDGPNGVLTVATAHLSFVPGYNVRQLRALVRWLADLPRPLVLLGDFNLPGGLPRRITGWTSLVQRPTYPSPRPRVQFDHVLADGVSADVVARARDQVHALPVSDHTAVTVDVDL